MSNKIEISIQIDILSPQVDVVVLRYDGQFTGVEWVIANELATQGLEQEKLFPENGSHNIIWKQQVVKQSYILIVGTKDIANSGYLELQSFAQKVLSILKREM